MNLQRLSPHQISVDLPLERARETVWRSFARANFQDVVIDREKNIVAASSGANWKSNGETLVAHFSEAPGATVVEVRAKTHFTGKWDFGRAKRRSKKLTDGLQAEFSRAPEGVSSLETPQMMGALAPIAAPTGGSSFVLGAPIYGVAMPAKRGRFVMTYAVLGLVLVHILSPVSWFYANRTLKDYGEFDPGDKKLVKSARIVSIIGTVLLLAIWGFQLYAISAR